MPPKNSDAGTSLKKLTVSVERIRIIQAVVANETSPHNSKTPWMAASLTTLRRRFLNARVGRRLDGAGGPPDRLTPPLPADDIPSRFSNYLPFKTSSIEIPTWAPRPPNTVPVTPSSNRSRTSWYTFSDRGTYPTAATRSRFWLSR